MALLVACTAGCGVGSVDLVLDLPADADLAPVGARTVTLVTAAPGNTPRATTSEIAADGSFDLGKLPVDDGLSVSVVLRSPTQRVVGYGEAPGLVDVVPRDVVEVDVPMRRPFAYLTGAGANLQAFDTTADSAAMYQREVATPAAATLAAAAGGDLFVIDDGGSGAQARLVSGATHTADSTVIDLPGGPRDAAATTDHRFLVVGDAGGMTVVDTVTGMVASFPVTGGVDRVTIAARAAGGLRAIGLAGRVLPGACGRASQILDVSLDDLTASATMVDPGVPLADVAGTETSVDVVAVDPCSNALIRLAGTEAQNITLADVPAPTDVAAMGGQAWALGSVPGVVDNTGGSSTTTVAGHLVLIQAAVDGSASGRADLHDVTQVVAGYDDMGTPLALNRDINAHAVTPRALVVVPPGDQVAVLYDADFHAPALSDGFGEVIPDMTSHTSEYELLNATGGAVVQRVLTHCDLTYDDMGAVASWKCLPAPGAGWPQVGQFTPKGLAVLYGSR
jgi:hypothetical protein